MDMPVDYYVWSAMLKHYQGHMLKLANIMPNWKTILSTIQNDLLYKFIDKSIASDLDRVLLQLVGTYIVNTRFVNTLFEYGVRYRHLPFMIETLELLIKSCEKFCATAWSLEKVNFKV